MTLFNSKNMPPVIYDGEDILHGHRNDDGNSGIMFYNNEGFECGGLIFGGRKDESGSVSMGMSLTFDQFRQDQVMQLLLTEQNGVRNYGMYFFDRPEMNIKEFYDYYNKAQSETDSRLKAEMMTNINRDNACRMFVGKNRDDVLVSMYDKDGNPKIRLSVDKDGEPHIVVNGKEIKL